jgi:hypothetical protein
VTRRGVVTEPDLRSPFGLDSRAFQASIDLFGHGESLLEGRRSGLGLDPSRRFGVPRGLSRLQGRDQPGNVVFPGKLIRAIGLGQPDGIELFLATPGVG